MIAVIFPILEAFYAEIVLVAGAVSASNSNLQGRVKLGCAWGKHDNVTYGICDVSGADLADVFDTTLAAPSRGLLADDAHVAVVGAVGEVLVLFPLLAFYPERIRSHSPAPKTTRFALVRGLCFASPCVVGVASYRGGSRLRLRLGLRLLCAGSEMVLRFGDHHACRPGF